MASRAPISAVLSSSLKVRSAGLPARARRNDQVRMENIADQRQAGLGRHLFELPGRAVLPVGVHELQAVGAELAADRDHFLQGEEAGPGPGIEKAVPQDPVEVVVDQQNAGGHGGRSRSSCRPGRQASGWEMMMRQFPPAQPLRRSSEKSKSDMSGVQPRSVQPPSTVRIWPVTKAASSLARKTQGPT